MIQNLVWATAYNVVAIPVAGGFLVRWGLDLPMSIGAVAMSASTMIVAVNAHLLRRLKLQRLAHSVVSSRTGLTNAAAAEL
jgi:P-type Cu2+ transporter